MKWRKLEIKVFIVTIRKQQTWPQLVLRNHCSNRAIAKDETLTTVQSLESKCKQSQTERQTHNMKITFYQEHEA